METCRRRLGFIPMYERGDVMEIVSLAFMAVPEETYVCPMS